MAVTPTYPIILIPAALKAALAQLPPPLPKPKLPHPPQRLNLKILSLELVLTLVVAFFFPSLLWIGLGLTLLHSAVLLYSYPHRHHAYRQNLITYQQTLQTYQDQQQAQTTPEYIRGYQCQQIHRHLKRTTGPDGHRSNAQAGKSEAQFKKYLVHYFGDRIHTKQSLSTFNYRHPYSPDFTYIDPSTNLHIDIEIDEPYTYENNVPIPIHYLGKDDKRNQHFLNHGWIIIRFAEEQILQHPQRCCKTIAQTLAHLYQSQTPLQAFQEIPDLPLVSQWTEDEAIAMAENHTRRSYNRPIKRNH